MRFLIVNTDYPQFLHWLYAVHPGLETRSFPEQMQVRMQSLFGVADFYSRNLRKLGHEAWDIHANNEFIQRAWAAEHGLRLPSDQSWRARLLLASQSVEAGRRGKWLRGLVFPQALVDNTIQQRWMAQVLAAQIRHYQPDVLLNQAMDVLDPGVFRKTKRYIGLLAGQIGAPLPKREDYRPYDLILSSLPSFVRYFRGRGKPSELHRFSGFDPTILSKLNNGTESIDVSFVGSLTRDYPSRIRSLEPVCDFPGFGAWGPGVDDLLPNSPLRAHYRGEAWGLDMYRILRNSKITVNAHGETAGQYAVNMRLYEATGVSTLLITDRKESLGEVFKLDVEVVAYRSPKECAALVQHYLDNEKERRTIARAGQQRTLREHTYENRMRELIQILERYT